ncbi:MAG: hypothetical protein R3E45_01455 [Rhodocyclaceae bacterium]
MALPRGRHPLQLYSATPNGVKVGVMLEELLALGHTGAEYDAWLIRINEGDQFGSGFVGRNPNSKIPAFEFEQVRQQLGVLVYVEHEARHIPPGRLGHEGVGARLKLLSGAR